MTHHIEITYANNARVLAGPYPTRNDANRALVLLIKQSRALDAGTDSEITDAKLVAAPGAADRAAQVVPAPESEEQ